MKRFAAMFLAVLIIVESFLFFGGYALFDFANHFYLAGGVWSLIIAAVVQTFVMQDDKITQLEKRVKELEEHKNT